MAQVAQPEFTLCLHYVEDGTSSRPCGSPERETKLGVSSAFPWGDNSRNSRKTLGRKRTTHTRKRSNLAAVTAPSFSDRVPSCSCSNGNETHLQCLLNSVSELYSQQILPTDTELRRRLEKARVCNWLLSNFVVFAAAHRSVFVIQPPVGDDDGCIFLTVPPARFNGFIDPAAPTLPYDKQVLPMVVLYLLDRLRQGRPSFRGGRFLMAMDLKCQGPPVIREMTVGQLCHLVQLLLSLGVIAYDSNSIKVVSACEALTKAAWSRNMEPGNDSDEHKLEEIRNNLRKLLERQSDGVVLSQLRTTYETLYDAPLDFGSFGHTKLAQFLETLMADVCWLAHTGPFNAVVLPRFARREARSLKHKCSNSIPPHPPSRASKSVVNGTPSHVKALYKDSPVLRYVVAGVAEYRWDRNISFSFWQMYSGTDSKSCSSTQSAPSLKSPHLNIQFQPTGSPMNVGRRVSKSIGSEDDDVTTLPSVVTTPYHDSNGSLSSSCSSGSSPLLSGRRDSTETCCSVQHMRETDQAILDDLSWYESGLGKKPLILASGLHPSPYRACDSPMNDTWIWAECPTAVECFNHAMEGPSPFTLQYSTTCRH